MKHWSVSKSCGYCSVDRTVEPFLCDAAKNCPRLNECVDFSDIFSLKASTLPETPGVVCEDEHTPTAFSDGHRKTPASVAPREVADRWPAGMGRCLPGLKASLIELFDDSADVMFRVMNQFRDSRSFVTLFGSQHHLCSANLDAISTASQNSLNLLAFTHPEFAYAETHNSPPCEDLVVSLCNIGKAARII